MSDNAISSTTQDFLDVYDIANNMVLLKDGTVSVILQIGTMNFSLLAEQEQDAIIYTYASLLNSLNFPIQINIQSNVKDASKYLSLLKERAAKTTSREQAQRINKYHDFVANLIHERNVLEKKFYVVIPTSVAEMGLYTAKNVLPGQTKFDIHSIEKAVLIEKASTVLDPRTDHIISQFNRIGLFARQLNTQEIIQNFYINYNPEAIEGQEITNSENYTTPMVRADFGSRAKVVPTVPASQTTPPAVEADNPAPNPAPAPTPTPNPTPAPTQAEIPVQAKETKPIIEPSNIQTSVEPTPKPPSINLQTEDNNIFNEEIPELQGDFVPERPVSAMPAIPNQETPSVEQPLTLNNSLIENQELSVKPVLADKKPIAEL